MAAMFYHFKVFCDVVLSSVDEGDIEIQRLDQTGLFDIVLDQKQVYVFTTQRIPEFFPVEVLLIILHPPLNKINGKDLLAPLRQTSGPNTLVRTYFQYVTEVPISKDAFQNTVSVTDADGALFEDSITV